MGWFWKLLFVLCLTGSFIALCAYCLGRIEGGQTGYTTLQVEAMDRLVADSGITAKADGRDCGLDWLCLIQLANEQHPTKKRKRS